MHKCKVKSHSPTRVLKEEYESHRVVVKNSNFYDAIQQARQRIMGQEYTHEQHPFQNEGKLPLTRNMFGLYTLSVYVNHVHCTFVLDTGAQISGIKMSKLEDVLIRKTNGTIKIGSIGGTNKEMQGLCADSFQLGEMEFSNLPMIALDTKNFSLKLGTIDVFRFDGILGWDILSHLDFEIDDIKKELMFVRNRFLITHPNMITGSFPCFIVNVQKGYPSALFGFDSGSKTSWIGETSIQTYDLQIAQESMVLGFGVHGLEKMQLKIVKDVTCYLDKAKISLKNTITGRTALFDNFSFQGVFGNEIFKGRRIRILNSVNMVLIA